MRDAAHARPPDRPRACRARPRPPEPRTHAFATCGGVLCACAGFGFGFFLLYNRGIPATSSTSIDEAQVNREVAKKPVFIAAGLTVLFGAIGGTLSQLLPLSFLLEEATVAVGVVLGFFTSATFFKVQDEY